MKSLRNLAIGCTLLTIVSGFAAGPSAAHASSNPRVVESLRGSGLEKCTGKLTAIVLDQLNGEDDYGFLTHPSTMPNQRGSAVTTVADFEDGTLIRAFHVVPDLSRGCSLFVHMTFISAESCAKMRDGYFPEWVFALDLGSSVAYKQKADVQYHNNVVLTRGAGGSCVASKMFTLNYEDDR